jgi:flagellar biosynthesis protein FlhG
VIDQAENLRKIVANIDTPKIDGIRSIAIVSGKGGVGKSNISIFLAKALAVRGKKVLIFDGDLGLANLHILLGISPKGTLSKYLKNECRIEDIVHKIDENVDLIPGGSGDVSTNSDLSKMLSDLTNLSRNYDYLIIDGGAGIGENTLRLAISAGEVILLMTPDPTSLTDAYSTLKVLISRKQKNISLLINMAENENETELVKNKLFMLSENFLRFSPKYLGFLPQSKKLAALIREDIGVLSQKIGDFSLKINTIAAKIDGEQIIETDENQNFFTKFTQSIGGK